MKRWTKQKSGRQESKKRRHAAPGGPGQPEASSAGGAMSGMRRGLVALLGGRTSNKPKGAAEKLLDAVMWIAVVVAAIYFLQNRCMR